MPCGLCRQPGHNRRNCPNNRGEEQTAREINTETQLAAASERLGDDVDEANDIFSYIEKGNYKKLKEAIIRGIDLTDVVDEDGFSPIVFAILKPDLKAVTCILENATIDRNKFDINGIVNPIQLRMDRGREEYFGTPLMSALTDMLLTPRNTKKLEPIVLKLLEHGANPNIHSQLVTPYKRTDNTSLFVAVQTGVISVVRELISKRANVNDVSVHNGRRLTPLYAAGLAKENVKAILLLLLQNGANQTQLIDGKTALEHHIGLPGNIHRQHLAAIEELNSLPNGGNIQQAMTPSATESQFNGGGTMNPCIKGKRRNPKTKRCRKICTNGQRRNPKTKRCRTKCRTGFSRSRKSNRCVKN